MPSPGQRTHPTSGVKGGKPKILPSFKRKRLPKLPATPEAKDLQEQSSIYLKERNLAMRLKRMREEMLLAKERGQLIERELAIKQLSYLAIAMRQRLLALPLNIGNHFGDREVPIREVVEYAKRLMNETLTELSKLPLCVEPDWLEKLEEAEDRFNHHTCPSGGGSARCAAPGMSGDMESRSSKRGGNPGLMVNG